MSFYQLGHAPWSTAQLSALTARIGRRSATSAFSGLEPLESRQLLTVVISEFMASNQSTLTDDDGFSADWIELENRGAAPVDLDGWFLTDRESNLRNWQFPEVTLPAGERLLVYASEKDRTDPLKPLHTNFKLSADGEYLALVQADGMTVEFAYAPDYPPQSTDVSYGLAPTGTARGYFPEPSPGLANPVAPISGAGRSIVINEIMYSLPRADLLDAENIDEEYIELHNRGTAGCRCHRLAVHSGSGIRIPGSHNPRGRLSGRRGRSGNLRGNPSGRREFCGRLDGQAEQQQ